MRLLILTLTVWMACAPGTAQGQPAPRGVPSPETMATALSDLRAGNYEAAERAYSRLLPSFPRNPNVVIGLAHAELGLGKLESAYARLQLIRTLDPDNGGVHFVLGQLFLKADMPLPAAHALTRAVSLEPSNQTFRLALARSLSETGQLYAAASQYGRLLEQMDQEGRRPDPAVVYELADLATRLNMNDDARRLYRLLLNLEPNSPRAAVARQWLERPEAPAPPQP